MADLIDTNGIADMLRLHPKHVRDRLMKQPDAPRPEIRLARKMLWSRQAVLDWLKRKS